MTDTKEAVPECTLTLAELADELGLTPRRVRQMRENGELVTRGRGRLDAPHALNYHLGRRALGSKAEGADKFTVAAYGWLLGHHACGVSEESLAAWHKAAARWGLSEAEATAVLLNGAALLGDRAPRFDAKPTKGRR